MPPASGPTPETERHPDIRRWWSWSLLSRSAARALGCDGRAVEALLSLAEENLRPDLRRPFARELERRACLAGLVEGVQGAGVIAGRQVDDAGVIEAGGAISGIKKLCTSQVNAAGGRECERQVVSCRCHGR